VTVQDKSLEVKTVQRVKADPAVPGQVGAPIPGAVTSVVVDTGDHVEKGQRLLVMEAMKMQTTVYAPVSGVVKEKMATVGQTVDAKDLLLVIE
jgi:pyruvate carboxylase